MYFLLVCNYTLRIDFSIKFCMFTGTCTCLCIVHVCTCTLYTHASIIDLYKHNVLAVRSLLNEFCIWYFILSLLPFMTNYQILGGLLHNLEGLPFIFFMVSC